MTSFHVPTAAYTAIATAAAAGLTYYATNSSGVDAVAAGAIAAAIVAGYLKARGTTTPSVSATTKA